MYKEPAVQCAIIPCNVYSNTGRLEEGGGALKAKPWDENEGSKSQLQIFVGKIYVGFPLDKNASQQPS
jgi:hypothetical protein